MSWWTFRLSWREEVTGPLSLPKNAGGLSNDLQVVSVSVSGAPFFFLFFSIFFFHTLGRRRSGKSCQFRHRLRGSSSSGSIDLGLKSKDIRDRADGRVIGRWNPPTNTENNASHLLFFPPSSSSPKQLFRAFFFYFTIAIGRRCWYPSIKREIRFEAARSDLICPSAGNDWATPRRCFSLTRAGVNISRLLAIYIQIFFPVVGNVRDWRRPLSIPWSILTAPAILIAFFSVAAISSVKSSPDVHRWAHSSNVKCARPNNFESLKKLSSQSDGRALNHSITKSFSAEKEISHFLVIRADTSETINFPPKIPPKKKKNWKKIGSASSSSSEEEIIPGTWPGRQTWSNPMDNSGNISKVGVVEEEKERRGEVKYKKKKKRPKGPAKRGGPGPGRGRRSRTHQFQWWPLPTGPSSSCFNETKIKIKFSDARRRRGRGDEK